MGHWKQLLFVDLDEGDAETRPLSPDVCRAYLGGTATHRPETNPSRGGR